MNLKRFVNDSVEAVGNAFVAVGRGIAAAASATGNFLKKHWAATSAVVLGLIAFAVVTVALAFFWPATITAIASLSVALPFLGTVAPLAFLTALSTSAGAAVVGAFAFGAVLAASAVINAFAALYNGLDRFFNPPKGNGRTRIQPLNDENYDDSSFQHLSRLGRRREDAPTSGRDQVPYQGATTGGFKPRTTQTLDSSSDEQQLTSLTK